jgi:hypothetical protein
MFSCTCGCITVNLLCRCRLFEDYIKKLREIISIK